MPPPDAGLGSMMTGCPMDSAMRSAIMRPRTSAMPVAIDTMRIGLAGNACASAAAGTSAPIAADAIAAQSVLLSFMVCPPSWSGFRPELAQPRHGVARHARPAALVGFLDEAAHVL